MNKFISLCLCVLLLPSITSASDKMKLKDIKWLQGISEVKAIGCDSYEDSTYSSTGRDELEVPKSSFREKRLNPDSKITCDLWAKTDDIKKPVLQVFEEFKIDGVNVHIYHSDASGTIGKDYSDNSAWNSACKTDTMTDDVTCYVSRKSFYMFKNKTGYYLLVGSDHFPQTVAYIRLGKDKPISSGKDGLFSSADSLKIMESIDNQTTLSTRYTKWPYETPVDEKLDTKYFEQAKKFLDLIFDNHV